MVLTGRGLFDLNLVCQVFSYDSDYLASVEVRHSFPSPHTPFLT